MSNPMGSDGGAARLDRRAVLRNSAAGAALSISGLPAPTAAVEAAVGAPPQLDETERRAQAVSGAGFSEARLGRMREVMAGHVERGVVPGVVTLVSRRGEVHAEAIGETAFDGGGPMRRDTIFRIASVTKPITAGVAMILVEECVLRLDEPVDNLLPELADRQVLKAIDGPVDDTVPANRPITLRDMLTFRLGYGAIFDQSPFAQAFTEAGVAPGPRLPGYSPDDYLKRLGGLPLAHQPGERWLYNNGSDVLGILIARATGQSLGTFLRERIFDPLGMKDTGFHVPVEKQDRLPTAYWTDFETGGFGEFDAPAAGSRFALPPPFESGAGGLVSTADDLLAFGRMMLDNGTHEGQRILSRASVGLMTMDHLTPEQKAASAAQFFPGFFDNRGWGFGVSVYTQRTDLSSVPGRFGWDGGYGTSWYVDPSEELIGILLTQRLWDGGVEVTVLPDFWTTTYAAIED
jgi:CubicO group peptidase (beta-lactamase class C family)